MGPLHQGVQHISVVLTCEMREARPAMPDSPVSVRTPQDEVRVLRRCTITDSRVLPPSSICLHRQAPVQAAV